MQPDELETRTMHVFISRALQKVLKECPKKHTQLRQSCAAVIEELKEKGAETFPLPTPEQSTESPPSTHSCPARRSKPRATSSIAPSWMTRQRQGLQQR